MAVTGAATLAPCDGFFVPALSLYALLCASDTLINDICSVNVNFINSRNFHARRVASPPKTCLAWPKQNADASAWQRQQQQQGNGSGGNGNGAMATGQRQLLLRQRQRFLSSFMLLLLVLLLLLWLLLLLLL